MYKNKKILAIILARGGSKGIKNKNLKKINNLSLVGHAGILATKINLIDKIIISTDSKKIGEEAEKFNIDFFFYRPKKLSGDKISDEKVLCHALKKAEKYYLKKFDIIISLPPTSPLRKKKDVIHSIKKMIKHKHDSLWTISLADTKYHPKKALKLNDFFLKYYHKDGSKIKYRQQLDETYYRNGVAYVISRKILLKNKIFSNNTGYHIVKSKQISIDSFEDLKNCEKILKKISNSKNI